jgi:hypothetical protein
MLKDELNLYNLYSDLADDQYIISKEYIGYNAINSTEFEWPLYVYNILRDQTISKIEEIADKIEKDKIPPFIITQDKEWSFNLQEFLETKGFRKIDQWPIMSFSEFEKIEEKPIEGFEIHFIKSIDELKIWFDIVKKVLFPKKNICFGTFEQKLSCLNYSFVLGYYNNEPVSTGLLFTKDNISGIYMIATTVNARKKGIGTKITNELLKKSKSIGSVKVTLQSSRMAHNGYLKIGFKVIETLSVYWMLNKLKKK